MSFCLRQRSYSSTRRSACRWEPDCERSRCGTEGMQQIYLVFLFASDGSVQCSLSRAILCVDVGAELEERAHDLQCFRVLRRYVQRRATTILAGFDLRTVLDEDSDDCRIRSEMQRGDAVVVACIHICAVRDE